MGGHGLCSCYGCQERIMSNEVGYDPFFVTDKAAIGGGYGDFQVNSERK